MTDYLSCGSCPSEFELRDFTNFIEHKLSNSCHPPAALPTTNILECLQCFKKFHTSMSLLIHLQKDHRLAIVKMYSLPISGPVGEPEDYNEVLQHIKSAAITSTCSSQVEEARHQHSSPSAGASEVLSSDQGSMAAAAPEGSGEQMECDSQTGHESNPSTKAFVKPNGCCVKVEMTSEGIRYHTCNLPVSHKTNSAETTATKQEDCCLCTVKPPTCDQQNQTEFQELRLLPASGSFQGQQQELTILMEASERTNGNANEPILSLPSSGDSASMVSWSLPSVSQEMIMETMQLEASSYSSNPLAPYELPYQPSGNPPLEMYELPISFTQTLQPLNPETLGITSFVTLDQEHQQMSSTSSGAFLPQLLSPPGGNFYNNSPIMVAGDEYQPEAPLPSSRSKSKRLNQTNNVKNAHKTSHLKRSNRNDNVRPAAPATPPVVPIHPCPPQGAPGGTAFTCEQCGRSFHQNVHLRKHIMSYHEQQKPHKCNVCKYSTVEKSHLTVHMRKHTGEKPFQCRECGYSSAQNCTLKNHYFRKHPGSRILCPLCHKDFVTDLERDNHIKLCKA